MNTIELILVILVIMVVVGGIVVFSKGSKMAFLTKQQETGGKLMKYLPVIMVAFFLAFLLYTNIYVRNNKETVNHLNLIKNELKQIEYKQDSITINSGSHDSTSNKIKSRIASDSLFATQKKLYQLMDQVEKEKYLTGYSNTNQDSLQKLIILTNLKIEKANPKIK